MLWPPCSGECDRPPRRSPEAAAGSAPSGPPPTTELSGPMSAPAFFFETRLRQGHEEMRQAHQRHMMVPTDPRPRLVLRHPQVALGVLEEFLDPMAAARHRRQRPQRHPIIAVADVILDLGRPLQRAADQQPDRRPGPAVAYGPDPHRRELEDQGPDRP